MNVATSSAELLRDYAATGAEAPFSELVRRHVDLVYSAALRRGAGDATLAAEVAQTVFTDLARKARSPRPSEAESVLGAMSLSGWLYHHTGFVAATAIRSEVRRRDREKTAMLLQAQTDATDWSRVAPVLEEAMAELPDRDRDALVLRFFEKESFARIGAALGASEDAARMRVDRALDRLRESLAQRGVTSTAAALGSSLTAFGVAPAPAGLAAAITSATAAAVAASAVPFFAFKPIPLAVSTGLAVVALWIAGYQTWDARTRLAAAERDRVALGAEIARLQAEREAARLVAVSVEKLAPLRPEQAELLRLRGELARLRRELANAAAAHAAATNAPELAADIQTRPVQVLIEGKFIEVPDAVLKALGLNVPLNGSEGLSESQAKALLQRLEQQEGVDILSAPRVLTLGGRSAEISVAVPAEEDDPPSDTSRGPSLTMQVAPLVAQDSRQVALTLNVGYLKPTEGASGAFGFTQSAQAFVLDGQSVLLRPPAQPATGSGMVSNGPRSLLVLVTPTLMDAAGRPLYPPGASLPTTAEPSSYSPGSPAP